MSEYVLNFDGSCYPNPNGMAACGYVIKKDGVTISKVACKIGVGPFSNNYAEFYGTYLGLLDIAQIAVKSDKIFVRGDSQLAINVFKKKFRAKSESLYYPAYEKADEQIRALRNRGCYVTFDWIPRAMNSDADELSKYDRKE
jgi:ribonuclease HI